MANIRLVALLAFLIFLSLPPTLPSQGLQAIARAQNLFKLFKVVDKIFKPFSVMMDVYSLFSSLGVLSQPKDSPPASSTEAESIGFYISFSVGNTTQPMTARMSIGSVITSLYNYEPSYTSTHQCCTANLSCSTTACNGDYYIDADTFTFENGQLKNVPYMYDPGNRLQKATGFLSLSKSPYSLLRTAQEQSFSYRFSDDNTSYFTLGGTAPTATTLQSTNLLTNPSHRNLYYINLTRISTGKSSYEIDAATNSSNVILDTVIAPTLLETAVYAQVIDDLKKIRKGFGKKYHTNKDNGLEVCYSRSFFFKNPRWPNLSLFFPSDPSNSSASAEMVLTKNNYVVTVKKWTGKEECAAIFETQGASVIGMMAQINRQMLFDLSSSKPRIYFAQYTSGGSSAVRSVITILIWSLSLSVLVPINLG